MPSQSLTIEEVLSLLSETPLRLEELTAGLAPTQLRGAPAGDAWSAPDVLAHLRACADVWGGSMVMILAEDKPTIRAVNPRRWIEKTDYLNLEFQHSLRAFAAQRADLLAVLGSLPQQDWGRAATVTGAGQVLEWTVLHYGQRLARHERQHVRQVASIVNQA